MTFVLGIETSCDETGAAVYDLSTGRILSNSVFSQVKMHAIYGGVVPEIASRSQLEKINPVVQGALQNANVAIDDISLIAVANGPGLAGSLFVGLCFAKGLCWARNKKIVGINHLEGHIFSSFLKNDLTIEKEIQFPHLCLSASGGHTVLYLVNGFGDYQIVCHTIDDAAGEVLDKVAKILGYTYPGGPVVENLAQEIEFKDFMKYPRTKNVKGEPFFSFSGLKTAVLYDLVKRGAYNLNTGPITQSLSEELKQQVASSLLVCVGDIFTKNVIIAFKKFPEAKGLTFVGGVACNKYLRRRLENVSSIYQKNFFAPPHRFCTDNAAMIAFVGGYKFQHNKFDDFELDIWV